jgi:HlyD family secretion protein
MTYKYLLPLLAVVGALFGLYVVFWSQKSEQVAPILFPPPRSPYSHAIAGAGLIETSSENIAIGSPFNEVVEEVYIVEGDHVTAGQPLFQLDLRNFKAQAESARATLNGAQISLNDKIVQFDFYQRLSDKRAVSEQTYQQFQYAVFEAEQNVKIAQANLELAETNIQKSIIRAPIDGQILQVNIHKGEVAPASSIAAGASTLQTGTPEALILMGRIDPLQVKIDIDENDAWRYQPGAAATAFVRGNSHINFPLTYSLIEPYVVPKSSFTGATIERVDTRVLQVRYTFEKKEMPLYVGQILDIFIESKPISSFVVP